MITRLIDLSGAEFGNLIVLHRAPNHETPCGQAVTSWVCKCKCGKEITVTSQNLRRGHTKSCGCLIPQHNLKHGDCVNHTISRLYNIWAGMKARCYNTHNPRYEYYGKRGIKVCNGWLSFESFRRWALCNGYSDDLTIDRIDNDGDYAPGNCRWTTQKVQSNNSRKNVTIEYNHSTHTISEWADIFGIPYKTLWYRISSGWDIETALTTPLRGVVEA